MKTINKRKGGTYMLVPNVPVKEFERYGFKPCKGIPKELNCYYLCVARGCSMLFVSDKIFDIYQWTSDDPRIHKRANCRYSDNRTALDIVYQLIEDNMLVSNCVRRKN